MIAANRTVLQFPWARYGQKNQNSSCWVRVASVWSGLAPDRKPGVQSMFVHGQGSAPGMVTLDTRRTQDHSAKAMQRGYDHQGSYKDERAQWATAYGIVQLAKLADWAA